MKKIRNMSSIWGYQEYILKIWHIWKYFTTSVIIQLSYLYLKQNILNVTNDKDMNALAILSILFPLWLDRKLKTLSITTILGTINRSTSFLIHSNIHIYLCIYPKKIIKYIIIIIITWLNNNNGNGSSSKNHY